jgi:hypothetical protein
MTHDCLLRWEKFMCKCFMDVDIRYYFSYITSKRKTKIKEFFVQVFYLTFSLFFNSNSYVSCWSEFYMFQYRPTINNFKNIIYNLLPPSHYYYYYYYYLALDFLLRGGNPMSALKSSVFNSSVSPSSYVTLKYFFSLE